MNIPNIDIVSNYLVYKKIRPYNEQLVYRRIRPYNRQRVKTLLSEESGGGKKDFGL